MKKLFFILLFCLTGFIIGAQEKMDNELNENNKQNDIEIGKNDPIEEEVEKEKSDEQQLIGLIFSFGEFNNFRFGMGLVIGTLRSDGHHPFGYDYGLLFEYNFKENIKYNRIYFHLTGGVGAMLIGGSMALAYDNNDLSVGFSPEIGFGLSTLFGVFYRYTFYLNNKFNSHEFVFHINICKRN
jgi:hypothetical protein